MSRSFQIRFDFVSVGSSISGLAVGFSVSNLLVYTYTPVSNHSIICRHMKREISYECRSVRAEDASFVSALLSVVGAIGRADLTVTSGRRCDCSGLGYVRLRHQMVQVQVILTSLKFSQRCAGRKHLEIRDSTQIPFFRLTH